MNRSYDTTSELCHSGGATLKLLSVYSYYMLIFEEDYVVKRKINRVVSSKTVKIG